MPPVVYIPDTTLSGYKLNYQSYSDYKGNSATEFDRINAYYYGYDYGQVYSFDDKVTSNWLDILYDESIQTFYQWFVEGGVQAERDTEREERLERERLEREERERLE
jgi:hypothetical protein